MDAIQRRITAILTLLLMVILIFRFYGGEGFLTSVPITLVLKQLGLSPNWAPNWFIVVLFLLALNLGVRILSILFRFFRSDAHWETHFRRIDPVRMRKGYGKQSAIYLALPVHCTSTEFHRRIPEWARANWGELRSLQSIKSPEKIQYLVRTRNFRAFWELVVCMGLGLALGGFYYSSAQRMEVKTEVREGGRGRGIQPDFELRSQSSELRFQSDFPLPAQSRHRFQLWNRNEVISLEAEVLKPARWKDFYFYHSQPKEGAGMGAVLVAKNEKTGAFTFLPKLEVGEMFSLPLAKIQLLTIQPMAGDAGQSVQIDYQDQDRNEKVWLFLRHPDYDFVHRKGSAYTFSVTEISPMQNVPIRIVRDPGAVWIGMGFGIAWLGFVLLSLSSTATYWVVWDEGQVLLVALTPAWVHERTRLKRTARGLAAVLDGDFGTLEVQLGAV